MQTRLIFHSNDLKINYYLKFMPYFCKKDDNIDLLIRYAIITGIAPIFHPNMPVVSCNHHFPRFLLTENSYYIKDFFLHL